MKTSLLLLLLSGLLTGCGHYDGVVTDGTHNVGYNVVVVENCEYLLLIRGEDNSLTHKGNCTNTIHAR